MAQPSVDAVHREILVAKSAASRCGATRPGADYPGDIELIRRFTPIAQIRLMLITGRPGQDRLVAEPAICNAAVDRYCIARPGIGRFWRKGERDEAR